MNFKIKAFDCQQTTDNGQQTFSTVPEPVEGNSSAFLCVFARRFWERVLGTGTGFFKNAVQKIVLK